MMTDNEWLEITTAHSVKGHDQDGPCMACDLIVEVGRLREEAHTDREEFIRMGRIALIKQSDALKDVEPLRDLVERLRADNEKLRATVSELRVDSGRPCNPGETE